MPQYRARMVTSLDLLHMAELSDTSKALTFEQLVELREKTEVISQFLHKRLQVYVETLRLLLAPGRLLGKYVGVKEDVLGADKAVAQLHELYRGVCGKPFALSAELDEGPLKFLDNRLELYPWEYTHPRATPWNQRAWPRMSGSRRSRRSRSSEDLMPVVAPAPEVVPQSRSRTTTIHSSPLL
jgi:hypothetical protein